MQEGRYVAVKNLFQDPSKRQERQKEREGEEKATQSSEKSEQLAMQDNRRMVEREMKEVRQCVLSSREYHIISRSLLRFLLLPSFRLQDFDRPIAFIHVPRFCCLLLCWFRIGCHHFLSLLVFLPFSFSLFRSSFSAFLSCLHVAQ